MKEALSLEGVKQREGPTEAEQVAAGSTLYHDLRWVV